jgi:hypothetical protein
MPSPAETRKWIERGWRALALALLAWALAIAFRGPEAAPLALSGDALEAELPRITRAAEPAWLDVALNNASTPTIRGWLAALAHAGGRVEWRARAPIAPLAVELAPRADPGGGVRASVAAAPTDTIRLADQAGPLDTLAVTAAATTFTLPAFVSPLSVDDRRGVATAALRDTLALRRVLVIGAAGWEGKFILAALEERGWHASARFAVAPEITAAQGAVSPLDTAHFAVVIALDSASAAGNANAIAAFVRQGGGLILAGDAARAPSMAPFAPGTAGAHQHAASLAFADSAPRRALAFYAITNLKPDAIPLESREAKVAVAARRAGRGRVVQIGYDDTWRWRFAGGPRAPEAERAWWSGLVSSVSYRAALPIAGSSQLSANSAPLAALHATLGAPTADSRQPASTLNDLPWWLLSLIILSLLAEIASRRTRGAP